MRSPMMLRWICERARRDRQRDRLHRLVAGCSGSEGRRCRRGESAARPSSRMPSLGDALVQLGVEELHRRGADRRGRRCPAPRRSTASASPRARRARRPGGRARGAARGPRRPPRRRAWSASQATTRPRRNSWRLYISLANAVPRSKRSVTLVTRQPSFSAPTRFSTGTRTSSRNTSLNSPSPIKVGSGRISMPGRSIGRMSQRDAAVLRRLGVGAHQQLAVVARPARRSTRSSGRSRRSGRRRARRACGAHARSEPAAGSEKPWHHTSSPRRMRRRWRAFCSGVPSAIERRPAVEQADEVHADVGRLARAPSPRSRRAAR